MYKRLIKILDPLTTFDQRNEKKWIKFQAEWVMGITEKAAKIKFKVNKGMIAPWIPLSQLRHDFDDNLYMAKWLWDKYE